MKKRLFIIIMLSFPFTITSAQQKKITADTHLFYADGSSLTSGKQNDLYLLGKLWGFIKYFHPAVAGGKINWDKELINFLPGYLNSSTKKQRNDSLLKWIENLGAVPACSSCNDSLLQNAKLKPDLSWINSKNFGKELEEKLRFILTNRQQGDQRYIKFYQAEGLNITMYQNEDAYVKNQYPEAAVRLIAVYRFWNAIEYWYPYKYNLPRPWNTVLKDHIKTILASRSTAEYTLDIQRLVASIRDGHGFVRSRTTEELKGNYYAPFSVKYIQKKFIVTNILNDSLAAAAAGIMQGDIITAINDTPVNKIIQNRLPFISASNNGYAMHLLCELLTRSTNSSKNFTINRNGKSMKLQVNYFYSRKQVDNNAPFFSYQKDSAICMLQNKIAYLNLGKLLQKDSAAITSLLQKSAALIIDCRQNAIEDPRRENANMLLTELLCDGSKEHTATTAQPSYPGVFKFTDSSLFPAKYSAHPYNKQVIILINEATMSVGELMSMIFKRAPNAILMGSTTAGADGAVTVIGLPGNISVNFTWFGMYWPDGTETQRVGLKPDIVFYPTIKGYQQQKDELLDNAILYLSEKK